MLVQNVSGSAGHSPPKYRTWIQYYRSQFKIKHALTCAEFYCTRTDIHGAHINKYYFNYIKAYHKTYIIPLCPKHNNPNFKQSFYIKYNTKLLECNYINYNFITKKYIIIYLLVILILSYIKIKLY